MELFLQVKDLFLQIYYVPGAQPWQFNSVRRYIELAAQGGLADAEPPFFDHRSGVRRHPLQQPRRNQPFICGGQRDHKRIQRCRVTWTQLAFENTDENFSIRHLGENLAPILFAKKFPCCFISQRQNAKHGDVVSRRGV